ncbi:MAG TPA: hypothetical protein VEC99_14175 [Clostridia bacterium]|nr:hypothetical protein [Clostridia bacterium]
MKLKQNLQSRLGLFLAGMAVAGSTSIVSAASPIVISTFDNASDTNAWRLAGGSGYFEHDSTQDAGGSTSSGSMKVTLTYDANATWQQVQPGINLDAKSFDSSKYWSISFDIKVDPNSALGSSGTDYGHFQAVLQGPGDGWNDLNWTALTDTYSTWQHVELGFMPPYDNVNSIVIQVGDGGFTGDVTYWLDNIQINPLPESYFINRFTSASEVSQWAWQSWSKPGTAEHVTSPDAGGATPAGSVKFVCNFEDIPGEYQQVVFQKGFTFDPSRFVYLDMDVRLDPMSSPAADGSGSYGDLNVHLQIPGGTWPWVQIGSHGLSINDTNWTHLSFPLGGKGLTNVANLIFQLGRGWAPDHGLTNTITYYVDNIRIWTPLNPPALTLKPASPGGLRFTATNPNDPWQRQNIVTHADNRSLSWVNMGQPVTYSFTITNFADAAKHPGFEAHMYLVNYDTLQNQGDETYSAVDWNGTDVIIAKIQNNGGGGVDFSFNFKTNLPGANVNQTVAVIHEASALGTWALTFNDNTSVTLTTPSGATTNFTISAEVANAFGGQMAAHFGIFKNNLVNNGASATFSRVQITGVYTPVDDSFAGPGLNPDPANPVWRLALGDATGLVWVPPATAYWLDWTLPDSGFRVQAAESIAGPWTDLTLPYVVDGLSSRSGAVPAASLPSAQSYFFRMVKPNE